MKNRDTFSIDLVSPLMRAANGLIFAVILGAEITASGDAGPSLAGIAILLVTALGAIFEERWVFDLKTENAHFRFGVVFLAHRRSIPFSSIRGVDIEDFERGFRKQPWTRIVLRLSDRQDEIIASVEKRRGAAAIAKAERLRDYFAAR